MLSAIQTAYYKQARNPSDYEVLYELADSLDLDVEQFKKDIYSVEIDNELMDNNRPSRSVVTPDRCQDHRHDRAIDQRFTRARRHPVFSG
mgnify:CR=1 FL=1